MIDQQDELYKCSECGEIVEGKNLKGKAAMACPQCGVEAMMPVDDRSRLEAK